MPKGTKTYPSVDLYTSQSQTGWRVEMDPWRGDGDAGHDERQGVGRAVRRRGDLRRGVHDDEAARHLLQGEHR